MESILPGCKIDWFDDRLGITETDSVIGALLLEIELLRFYH